MWDMSGFLLWLSQLATRPTVLCIISWGGLAALVGSHSQPSAQFSSHSIQRDKILTQFSRKLKLSLEHKLWDSAESST